MPCRDRRAEAKTPGRGLCNLRGVERLDQRSCTTCLARRRRLRGLPDSGSAAQRRATHRLSYMAADSLLAREIKRRRTFAIISHPDAGKTTLTEKLLLYGGAIQLAGAVKAKRGRALGRQRLDGDGARARDLDHVERAAVSVPRLRDEPARHAGPRRLQRGHLPHAARGRRGGDAPRLRQGRRAADQEALPRLQAAQDAHLHLREQDGPPGPRAVRPGRRGRERARHRRRTRSPGRSTAAHVSAASTTACSEARVPLRFAPARARRAPRSRRMRGDGHRRPDPARGSSTTRATSASAKRPSCSRPRATRSTTRASSRARCRPMFFGSAMNNFGLAPFLDTFCELMPPARTARVSSKGDVDPADDAFSGFIFKIQANMDKAHRDRVAFMRVCSGKFERGMKVHPRPHRQDDPPRQPHDLPRAGAHDRRRRLRRRRDRRLRSGHLRDRRHAHRRARSFTFEEIPSFAPEHFARVVDDRPAAPQAAQEGPRAARARGDDPALSPARRAARATPSSAPSAACSSRS